jgi:hypothetical protein
MDILIISIVIKNVQIHQITYHNNHGTWSKTCYVIFDSNKKISDNNLTFSLR